MKTFDLGIQPYDKVWRLQRETQQGLIAGTAEPTLLVCEHYPVITVGRSAKRENIIASEELLKEKGVIVRDIERGGDVTYHGPGQVVLYPLIDLHAYKKDVGWYMRALENVVLRTLRGFDLEGKTICGKTGVWMSDTKKIASIGIRISRWRTLHGLSLNVLDCTQGFSLINPCGFSDITVTSIAQERAKDPQENKKYLIDLSKRTLVENFLSEFSLAQENADATNCRGYEPNAVR